MINNRHKEREMGKLTKAQSHRLSLPSCREDCSGKPYLSVRGVMLHCYIVTLLHS